MSRRPDASPLPQLAELAEDDDTAPSRADDNFHFKVHIVVNPEGAADVTVSGGITPQRSRLSPDVNQCQKVIPQVCRKNGAHKLTSRSRSVSPRASRFKRQLSGSRACTHTSGSEDSVKITKYELFLLLKDTIFK
ncbi:hypothetical protein L9F63_000628 [Diploptera punctata]|uniref:Uncharacterized protein n=1 Tax=Diploptera punctata TaxID=6984 RepID=A0AAD8AP31_DIPPU|nr:hypothetical protein L9F63_000628 [Diploptera punctata]